MPSSYSLRQGLWERHRLLQPTGNVAACPHANVVANGGTEGCQLWVLECICDIVDLLICLCSLVRLFMFKHGDLPLCNTVCVFDSLCLVPYLQVVLCLSPVGNVLRVRARRFPALVQCTTINWFHPWTTDALQSVSYRFIQEIEGIEVRPLALRFPTHMRHIATNSSVNCQRCICMCDLQYFPSFAMYPHIAD